METTLSGVVFLCLGASCAIISGFLIYQEIGEVNRKLSKHEQIRFFFMYPGKMQKIQAEYRRFYPKGRVDLWRKVFEVACFIFMAATALVSGFLKK
jgi:hypothetical protein